MRFPLIDYKITKPKTCWWRNDWNPRRANNRSDILLGIVRVWHRRLRTYSWHLFVGRLVIRFTFCRRRQ